MTTFDIVTVYKNPKNYPGKFVARASHLLLGTGKYVVGDIIIEHENYYCVAAKLRRMRLTMLPRDPQDDPCILETWI